MTHDEIMAKLTGIFRDVFDDDELEINDGTTADDIPDWDSFAHINIIVATETAFKIKFQTAEIEGLKNVGHLVQLVEQKTASAAA